MPLPVSSTPTTPSTPSTSAPPRQLPRSAIPTPSRIPTNNNNNNTTTTTTSAAPVPESTEASEPRLQSPPQLSKSRMSREGTPSDSCSTDSGARMRPPPVPTRSSVASGKGKERTAIRRTTGARNLKEKSSSDEEKQAKKPGRSMSSRSATRGSSISTTASSAAKDRKEDALPKRNLRSRTTGTSTSAVAATTAPTTERKPTSAVMSRTMSSTTARKGTGERSAAATTSVPSRRPVSMHGDSSSPPNSSASAAPRKTTAPVKTHRRNLSTPAAAAASAPPPRPGTSASTASNVSKSRRPPFSTLQQNFAAPPPPPAATSRKAMPPPPLDPATVHQQTQLLQYSCLYANSRANYAQLTASATAKLKRRFDTLAREHSRSREQLARRQRMLDMAGLSAVVEAPAAGITGKRRETMRSPEEKIQAFSEAIKKLESLQQNEHRAIANVFGEWIAGYSPPAAPGGSSVEQAGWIRKRGRWIDGLGEDWRRQCLFTSRRIEAAVRAIESVVAAVVMEEEAGVVSVVSERWMDVAKGMLEESQGMMLVEGNVVQRERKALEEVVAAACNDDSGIHVAEDGESEEQAVWAC